MTSRPRAFATLGLVMLVLLLGLASWQTGLSVISFIVFISVIVLFAYLYSLNRRQF